MWSFDVTPQDREFHRGCCSPLRWRACGAAPGPTRARAPTSRVGLGSRPTRAKRDPRRRSRARTPRRRRRSTFTITEQARISGEARAQFDGAVRLLEQQRYDRRASRCSSSGRESARRDRAVHQSRHRVRAHRRFRARRGEPQEGDRDQPEPPGRLRRARPLVSRDRSFRGRARELREGARDSLRASTSRTAISRSSATSI